MVSRDPAMRVSAFRGHKPLSAAVMAQCVDEVVVGVTHVALLLHDRTTVAVMDRVPAAASPDLQAADQVRLEQASQVAAKGELAGKAGLLVRSFAPARVASVAWEAGPGGASVRMAVVLRDGGAHWWEWDIAKLCWTPAQSKRLVNSPSGDEIECAVPDPLQSGSWLCLESNAATTELSLWRRTGVAGGVLLARVPGDGEGVRLWACKEPVAAAWMSSDYGGLCCVNLADPKPFCPPSFFKKGLIEQHPATQELVLLDAAESKVFVLRPFMPPHLLCTLASALAKVVGMAFLHKTLFVLDDNGARCSTFDLGTGAALRTHATPPGLRLAGQALPGPFVVLWGASVGFQTLQHEAVPQVQALLPAERGARMAQEWGLRRLAAWRLLSDGKDAAAVAAFTATPALSVAMAGGSDDARLIELTRKHLANDTPKHAFETLSTLTAQVNPLLQQWADASLPLVEYAAVSEQEVLEVRALEEPEAVLDELLANASGSDEPWKFCLTCRLLLALRPEMLPAFASGESAEGRPWRLQLAADSLAVATPQPRSEPQVRAAARVMEEAGNAPTSARLLIANGFPQTLDLRLAFAEALRSGDEEALVRLWAGCDWDDSALFRLLLVHGEDGEPLTVRLLKRILAARE